MEYQYYLVYILFISDQIMHKSGTNDQFPLNFFGLFAFSLGLGLSLDLETNTPGLYPGLVTKTRRFKVLVSVSTLRLQDS